MHHHHFMLLAKGEKMGNRLLTTHWLGTLHREERWRVLAQRNFRGHLVKYPLNASISPTTFLTSLNSSTAEIFKSILKKSNLGFPILLQNFLLLSSNFPLSFTNLLQF